MDALKRHKGKAKLPLNLSIKSKSHGKKKNELNKICLILLEEAYNEGKSEISLASKTFNQ
jgi:hypothetical protein